ncbi:Protein prenylyltransferase [Glarea lozoyensis ATCC 20868]|uniref:Protein prenylyltransferase n=1 Tax=Glarea lozoyensis (strain ATCC 20868 / MF5171) TaxID=1116229 RepID=S3DGL9_GLAL2|nr:Protein prenylyltransferase [Glarea lozoyensis ATCC 20868]EPE36820.1 Protein prenylyltransferase [Glarea lozoyensis ATCC 20868]
MSRALDPETSVSVQDSLPVEIYDQIVAVLCTPRDLPLEIELLGKAHPIPSGETYLLEENYLAIPKAKLVQAFVVARQIFSKLFRKCSEEKRGQLRDATAVMLLMDPEHLTAANFRKSYILYHEKGERFGEVLSRELQFVDTYLTARLHRHTKSPNLWSHRRWLVQQYRRAKFEVDVKGHFEKIVLIAAERHPSNYYAWSHMRWLVDKFASTQVFKLGLLPVVQDWCLRHPSDTSGFSFLLYCLDIPRKPEIGNQDVVEVYKEILNIALSFKWAHESVWVFLRTVAASVADTDGSGLSFEEAIDTALQAFVHDKKTQLTLNSSMKWYTENRQTVSS